MDKDDQRANEQALVSGSRVFGAFNLSGDRRVWVITDARNDEGQRESTTVMFPDEY